ncbi:MAG: hypothetical protein ISR55_01485 [Bacteroidetes bacterium]|nr:hypothetical protein [Bacteroidota bacterium]
MNVKSIVITPIWIATILPVDAQVLQPQKTFAEHTGTHNAHICFDVTLLKTFDYSHGSFGFSLSHANNMIFIAKDGNYHTGYWYGYLLK